MLAVPPVLKERFETFLRKKTVPIQRHGEYHKWLRYHPDFCQKDRFFPGRNGGLPRVIRKLQEKKQTEEQRRQAVRAITLYYEIVKQDSLSLKKNVPSVVPLKGYPGSSKENHSFREPPSKSVIFQKNITTPPRVQILPDPRWQGD